jgi:hypothetical protein
MWPPPVRFYISTFSALKVSWTFFAGLGAGLFLTFALTIAAFWLNLGAPTVASRWAADINQKKRLLADRVAAPKLLLAGGSATHFGFSAREIQSQTGYPTINLGTHAALGTAYILHYAQTVAKPGDTILLALEYELYNYGKIERAWADVLLLDYIVARDPAFFHALSPLEKWNVFMLTSNARLVRGLKGRFRHDRPPGGAEVYTLENINEWGDQTHHTQAARSVQRDSITAMRAALAYGLPERPRGFPLIASFCAWAATNHIRVLATFPNLCDQPEYHSPTAQKMAEKIRAFFAAFQVPVIGDYTDSLLPPDDFFDTNSHLTEEAARARTKRLVVQLKPYLE